MRVTRTLEIVYPDWQTVWRQTRMHSVLLGTQVHLSKHLTHNWAASSSSASVNALLSESARIMIAAKFIKSFNYFLNILEIRQLFF